MATRHPTRATSFLAALWIDRRWNQYYHNYLIIRILCLATIIIGAAPFTGCRAIQPRFPAANLNEPGWTILEGQAVWRLPGTVAELAGDVLLATREDGRAFVQFTKSPFPFVVAEYTPHGWTAEFPPQNKRYGARGKPPKRIIWLQLARILGGGAVPKGWKWQTDEKGWRLENTMRGEVLEGYTRRRTSPLSTGRPLLHDT